MEGALFDLQEGVSRAPTRCNITMAKALPSSCGWRKQTQHHAMQSLRGKETDARRGWQGQAKSWLHAYAKVCEGMQLLPKCLPIQMDLLRASPRLHHKAARAHCRASILLLPGLKADP